PVLNALRRAHARGVRVRALFDIAFADRNADSLERLLPYGVEVQLTRAWKSGGGVQHAKYMVVDGERLYLGSANFDWRSLAHIHEWGALIENRAMASGLMAVFEHDWAHRDEERGAGFDPGDTWSPWARLRDGTTVKLLVSPGTEVAPRYREIEVLDAMLGQAQRTLFVQLLNYDAAYRDGSPWPLLDRALRAAAARGVRVELLLSHWQAKNMDAVQSLQRVEGVDVRLATIPEATTGFIPYARVIHAKFAVVDGERGWVGTSNWKGDYFERGRNLALHLVGPAAAALNDTFRKGFDGPYAEPVDPDRNYVPANK
ncbi:MAG: phospholipase D-like domain-containing protein, partial [Myxococcota bacterium]